MGLHRRMHTHPTPHQSLSATASPKGEAKETHQPCRGDHRSPAFVRRLFFLPPSLREVARQRRAGRSLAESKTPPVTFRLRMFSRWENILPDEGMRAVGTAWCDVLLSSIPHQSPTLRTFSHRENSARRAASRTALPQGKSCPLSFFTNPLAFPPQLMYNIFVIVERFLCA